MNLIETLYPKKTINPQGARRISPHGEPSEEEKQARREEDRRIYWENYHAMRMRTDPAYVERRRKAAIQAKAKERQWLQDLFA